jgi:hypothetical protein
MTLLQTGQATQNDIFRLRVQAAVYISARTVQAEPVSTVNHELRNRLANALLADPSQRLNLMVWAVASEPSIAATVKTATDPTKVDVTATDDQIQTIVNNAWDAIAGWTPY